MRTFLHIASAFAVSFVGSLPMGYLNIAAWKINSAAGPWALIQFLAGVVAVEALMIALILIFIERISSDRRLMRKIGWLSVGFLIVLAAVFYFAGTSAEASPGLEIAGHHPFATGLLLSACNIMQVPFWTGWCLYLMQANAIVPGRKMAAVFAISASTGTFLGMIAIVTSLDYLAEFSKNATSVLVSLVMPVVFLVMAGLQARRLLRTTD